MDYTQSEGSQYRDAIFHDTRFRIRRAPELEFLVCARHDVHDCDRVGIPADRIRYLAWCWHCERFWLALYVWTGGCPSDPVRHRELDDHSSQPDLLNHHAVVATRLLPVWAEGARKLHARPQQSGRARNFVATFLYCLVVLRSVRGTGDSGFVPHLTVAFAVLLAGVGVGVLIYFIHHMATSIRIETLLKRLVTDGCVAVDRLFPEKIGHGRPAYEDGTGQRSLPNNFDAGSQK